MRNMDHISSMKNNKNIVQFVWGMLLIGAGGGMFFTIPQKMQQVAQQSPVVNFFAYLSLYLIGIILVVGGIKKIYFFFKKPDDKD